MNIFAVVKNEFLLVSTVENSSNAPLLSFDHLTGLTSENYCILTGLNCSEFDNLYSRIPFLILRNTQNTSARTAIAFLSVNLWLRISHQVLAALFSIKDEHTVSRVFHSARTVLVEYFALHFLGFGHIKQREVIDLHTRPLAPELLADEPRCAILILDGTYIYF